MFKGNMVRERVKGNGKEWVYRQGSFKTNYGDMAGYGLAQSGIGKKFNEKQFSEKRSGWGGRIL